MDILNMVILYQSLPVEGDEKLGMSTTNWHLPRAFGSN